jgi:integrase
VTISLTLTPGPDIRESRDRLELLTALIDGPAFDPALRADVIEIPADHRVFPWGCRVPGCTRPRCSLRDWCDGHLSLWRKRPAGVDRIEFLRTAEPLQPVISFDYGRCVICPGRPAAVQHPVLLCTRHHIVWRHASRAKGFAIEEWLAGQVPHASYGSCRATACADVAASPLGLCRGHLSAYQRAGRPGGAGLPDGWQRRFERAGQPVPVFYRNRAAFGRWCATAAAVYHLGQINLLGLSPLLKAEIKWGLFAHAQQRDHTNWHLLWIHWLVNDCRGLDCLADLDTSRFRSRQARLVAQEFQAHLRPVYFTPAASREAGFVDGRHFGFGFSRRRAYFDLTAVTQRWLRDLLWDTMTARMRSARQTRSPHPYEHLRRAACELSAFLEAHAPGGGHDPTVLRGEHMRRFVADHRNRAREGLPSLAITRGGAPTTISEVTRRFTFNYGRMLLRPLLESDQPEVLGLDREFITELPSGGSSRTRTRSPFTDEVARALADDANLQRLAARDAHDRGLRDIWETIVVTGRRAGEVLNLRLECLGRYNGLAILWHDQTKVGNYDEAVRIPEYIYDRLQQRQRTTLARFEGRHGRVPSPAERSAMVLFPSVVRNPTGQRSVSATWFGTHFRGWVEELDIGSCVPHQARHTLATRLLAAGAGLHHIRRYLGQLSIAMAEHYAKVSMSEVEDILQHVWVAGPGSARPGEVLSAGTTGMTREEAQVLAIDMSRRSTPAEGGFCTFQPVVSGGACPWNLNCHNCANFVMSGADLLYWRRKREQWMSIAEHAPDDATADYLHKVFEPTAAAIDGLEKALAAIGLLQEALSLDMRRPQDYFHRVWSTSFRATDLTRSFGHDGLGAEEASA